MPKIDLKCPNCGAECHWIEDANAKVCLHCGYQEKYSDSDAVKLEKIRASAELKKQKLAFISEHFSMILTVGLMLLCMIALGVMALLDH